MGIQTEGGAKKSTCKHSISRGKRDFYQKTAKILVDKQQHQQHKKKKKMDLR